MIDAAVELILHPLACPIARKQRHGAGNQVFKVQKAAPALQVVIALQKIVDQRERRQIEPDKAQFLQAVQPHFNPRRSRVEFLLEFRQKLFTAAEQT